MLQLRIYVCIKQVPDTETKITINNTDSGISDSGVKWVMNPYDELAVEEAIHLKSRHEGAVVTIISLGPKKRLVDVCRTALAMGADDAIVVDAPNNLDSHATAKALAAAISAEGPCDFIFTGKLAIDNNNSCVSQMVAEFLGLPHATVVSKFEELDGKSVVEREVEGGAKEILELHGPSVVGANKGLNSPRYPSLPGIMKAKKKPLKEIELSALGVDESQQKTRLSGYQLPPEKPPVKIISGDADTQAQQLASLLRNEAKVI